MVVILIGRRPAILFVTVPRPVLAFTQLPTLGVEWALSPVDKAGGTWYFHRLEPSAEVKERVGLFFQFPTILCCVVLNLLSQI
jgi:hypothetical protein